MQTELSLQSCALFVDNFCRSKPATAETETREATLPEQNTGFRARESFQTWIHAFPTCYTSQLLDDDVDGWHDDVIDMMVRMLAVTIVRKSEVF